MRNNISTGPIQLAMGFKGGLADVVERLQRESEKYQENGLGPKAYCQYTALSAKKQNQETNLETNS